MPFNGLLSGALDGRAVPVWFQMDSTSDAWKTKVTDAPPEPAQWEDAPLGMTVYDPA